MVAVFQTRIPAVSFFNDAGVVSKIKTCVCKQKYLQNAHNVSQSDSMIDYCPILAFYRGIVVEKCKVNIGEDAGRLFRRIFV